MWGVGVIAVSVSLCVMCCFLMFLFCILFIGEVVLSLGSSVSLISLFGKETVIIFIYILLHHFFLSC